MVSPRECRREAGHYLLPTASWSVRTARSSEKGGELRLRGMPFGAGGLRSVHSGPPGQSINDRGPKIEYIHKYRYLDIVSQPR